ncbi:MAG: N-6 DNA methylase, partial [Anaerolineae bacterium]|nr:N-6 DNA methylase [Anaerolineae bacterium]
QLLSSDRPGEYYPTPHHIAAFMAQMILPSDAVGAVYDPTCGSGGLLVAAKQFASEIEPIGTDYNGRWARLGVTNLYLNGVSQPQIMIRSAASFREGQPDERYDYVLMNPPFTAGTVESLLTLAIDSLGDAGKASLLAPSGIVQRNSDSLHRERNLAAVVSLPPDAMQPYNGIRAHVLCVDNERRTHNIWLVGLATDGYGSGRSRPLDQPEPPESSELPRTLALMQNISGGGGWEIVWEEGERRIDALQLVPPRAVDPAGVALLAYGAWEHIDWQLVHWSDGALVWLGEGTPLDADVRFWTKYRESTAHLVNTAELHWDALAELESTDISEWAIADSSSRVSVTIGTDQLSVSRHSLSFAVQTDAISGQTACVLNDSLQRISPWFCRTAEESLPDDVSNLGQTLFDASGAASAYLLPLSADDENSGYLLLTSAPDVTLYNAHGSHAGFLWQSADSAGLWTLSDRIELHSGTGVDSRLQRAERRAWGIAFGPNPTSLTEARMFAVCLARDDISETETLEPERYLPEVRQQVIQRQPAQILASIRKNQNQLSQRVDWLLQTMRDSHTERTELPANMHAFQEFLNQQQRDLWEHLQTQEGDFIPADLKPWREEHGVSVSELELQLEMFVLMGWLVRVHRANCDRYRSTQPADVFEVETA